MPLVPEWTVLTSSMFLHLPQVSRGGFYFHWNRGTATNYPISFMLSKLATCANSTSLSTHTQIIFSVSCSIRKVVIIKSSFICAVSVPMSAPLSWLQFFLYFELVEPPLRQVKVCMFIHITNSLASALITGPSIGMPTDPSRQNNWKSA